MNTNENSRIEQGNILLREGKFEEANQHAQLYVNELKSGTYETQELYEALNIIAFSYIRRTLSKDAIPIVQEMLSMCKDLPDDIRLTKTFRCNNIIGLLLFELSRSNEGLSYLERAYEIALELGDKDNLSSITGNLGLVHSSLSNDVKALELLRFSEDIPKELKTYNHLAIVSDNIATIFNKHGDYSKALEYFSKALELHTKSNAKDGIGRALGYIGSVYFSMNDLEKAQEYLFKALSIHEEIDYKKGIETWHEILGDIMLEKGNADEALNHFTKAIDVNRFLGNPITEAVHIGSIGDVHLHKGQLDEAYDCYNTALEMLLDSERVGDYYDNLLQMTKIKSNPEFAQHDISKAETILLETLESLRKLSLKSIELAYLNHLSDMYKSQGKWEEAYQFYVLSMNVQQEINSNEVRDKIKDMEFQQAYHQMEQQRLVELTRLQEKEQLLHEILPSHVAEKIIRGEKTIAEECHDMTIMFADIVGFTSLSEQLQPSQIIELLNSVYSNLDQLAEMHGIEKIKTIGDAYMAICNTDENLKEHKRQMLTFAKQIPHSCKEITLPNGDCLQIRIGIHSGPTVTGVIGTKKLSYDVWGDAVNTAARMESYGEPETIQISQEFYEEVKDFEVVKSMHFLTQKEVAMKGKGMMHTVLLQL
ncbi:MAG: tetratricopeptide repeat protein [Ignavibacteria bacterium]|nr:tetratricopeptide repeat protein [Ignavibacteria bacterium]